MGMDRLVVSDLKSVVVFEIVGGHRLKQIQLVKTEHVNDNIEVKTPSVMIMTAEAGERGGGGGAGMNGWPSHSCMCSLSIIQVMEDKVLSEAYTIGTIGHIYQYLHYTGIKPLLLRTTMGSSSSSGGRFICCINSTRGMACTDLLVFPPC